VNENLTEKNIPLLVVLGLMLFNATFNNISVLSWRSVLLVEETTNLPQITDKLYHLMLYCPSGNRTPNVCGSEGLFGGTTY
jgi:hypothetical protein